MSRPEPDEQTRCRDRALTLLTARSHARAELERKLRARGFAPAVLRPVLDDLVRLHLLDDTAFARELIRQKQESSRPLGRRRLLAELQRRGVAGDIVAQMGQELADAGSGEETAELARAVGALHARRRLRRPGRDPRLEQASCYRFLIGRGFSPDIVRRALADAGPAPGEPLSD
jgi:regulatory protein